MRIGFSKDIHALVLNRKLYLGGVLIPSDFGCLAHSDGDVLIHAIVDAIIGALGLGDIGEHFSDQDEKYKDINSSYFLLEAKKMLQEKHFEIKNIDTLIVLEKPKLKEYKNLIRKNVASILDIDETCINIKAGTNEKMDSVGRNEAIEAYAVVLLEEVYE